MLIQGLNPRLPQLIPPAAMRILPSLTRSWFTVLPSHYSRVRAPVWAAYLDESLRSAGYGDAAYVLLTSRIADGGGVVEQWRLHENVVPRAASPPPSDAPGTSPVMIVIIGVCSAGGLLLAAAARWGTRRRTKVGVRDRAGGTESG